MIIGNGYLPYHIRVRAAATAGPELERLLRRATGIKHELEAEGRITRFPDALIERLQNLPGVVQVCPDGAISSVVNPLKMARAFGNRPCAMHAVVGCGPIAAAIRADLARAGIALYSTVRGAADSSLEISLWDAQFRFWGEFQIHFLKMRERSDIFRLDPRQEEAAEALVFSRVNRSRVEAAGRLFRREGLVSFTVGGFSRHVRPEDYLSLLASAQHVVIRYPEIRPMAQALQVACPRSGQGELPAGDLLPLAERLGTYGGRRRLVMLTFRRAVCLYTPEGGLVRFQVPETHPTTVPTGELQGAVLAMSLAREEYVPRSADDLESLGNTALQAAYQGRTRFPLEYAGPAFRPAGTWRAGDRIDLGQLADPLLCQDDSLLAVAS